MDEDFRNAIKFTLRRLDQELDLVKNEQRRQANSSIPAALRSSHDLSAEVDGTIDGMKRSVASIADALNEVRKERNALRDREKSWTRKRLWGECVAVFLATIAFQWMVRR